MSTNLPLRLSRSLPTRCVRSPLTARQFSTTAPAWGRARVGAEGRRKGPVDPVMAEATARSQKYKAPSALQAEQMNSDKAIPDDLGLLPGTFVHEPLSRFSSLSLKERCSYEWKWFKLRFSSWFQIWRFKRSFRVPPNMHWRLVDGDRSQLRWIALEKYKHLYQSFASADTKALEELGMEPVVKKFQKRITARPKGLQMQWRMDANPSISIVSNIGSPLNIPGFEETGLHQVIFKIKSNQTLELSASERLGPAANYTPKTQQVIEYLVMQRQFIRGQAKEWKIWGFTEPSTLKSLGDQESYARKVNSFQLA